MSKLKQNVLKDIARPYFGGGIALVVFSFFTTLLNLVPPVFMMQLSERVMLSRNETTLLFLTVIALFLVGALTVLETLRSQVLARMSVSLDRQIGARVFDLLNRRNLPMAEAQRNQVLNDLNAFREFVAGPVIPMLLDLCWVPFLLLVMFVLHPILGFAMTAILLVIAGLSAGNQWVVGAHTRRAQQASVEAFEFARATRQSADTIRPMGMLPALTRRWQAFHADALGWHHLALQRAEVWTAAVRFVRNAQLVILLVVGALLYLNQLVTAGAVFAVAYIAMRVSGPVSSVTSSWRTIWNFRMALERLNLVLASAPAAVERMGLPRPHGSVSVSRIVMTAPGRDVVVLGDVSFFLPNGRILGVVGPSGAGKSSLAKLLVGAWQPRNGTVRLDEHDLTHWDEDRLGQYIGYVPQEIELLPGTVAENIARFNDGAPLDDEAVLEAARLAGIEDVIRDLPDGYNTRVGPGGHVFSGGQRQRIALARAVYGNPSLIVLDEPNSNLDAIGEQALGRALTTLKSRGATIVLVTHRMSMLSFCDDLLVMNAGTVHTFGPRELVMSRLPTYRLAPAGKLDAVAAQ
jgi:PrtD family type I secretion system ABC transporter